MVCKHIFLNEHDLFFVASEIVSSIVIQQSQFNISRFVYCIWPIDKTLSDTTSPV